MADGATPPDRALQPHRLRLHRAGWDGGSPALLVLGREQRLHLLDREGSPHHWPISTAAAGFGCRVDSGCTPTGLHRIHAKIGAGAPPGAVFVGRLATGEVLDPHTTPAHRDAITTRILWLQGEEEGINRGLGVDTRERFIYIHGTPHVTSLGRPASAGCVRMADAHVLQLFELVEEGAWVLIVGEADGGDHPHG